MSAAAKVDALLFLDAGIRFRSRLDQPVFEVGIPDELSVLDIMSFGSPAKPPYKRWKKTLSEITNWNAFDRPHDMADSQIDAWVAETRHKVMYRDAQNVD